MCTAISLMGLAGRTLDLECSFDEQVSVTPIGYRRSFVFEGERRSIHGLIGVAHIHEGVPLYYDAMSESGLYMAALNFPKCAVYREREAGKINLASAELIPYILGECRGIDEAAELLRSINITPDGVMGLPATPLHWFLSNGSEVLIIEPTESGVEITKNPHQVLANSPKLAYHFAKMAELSYISPTNPKIKEENSHKFPIYSRGMGAIGLPGDYSSSSRFVRAAFLAENIKAFGDIKATDNEKNGNLFSQIGEKNGKNGNNSPLIEENERKKRISAFFHLADSVAVPYGAVLTDEGLPVYTVYTSCADLASRTYYLTTYYSRTPRAYSFASLDKMVVYPLPVREKIEYFN